MDLTNNTAISDGPLEKIIDKYKHRPSITCINKQREILILLYYISTCYKKSD